MAEPINIFVAIAVASPEGDLDGLPGAITAANDLIAWADATREYRTLLITDEKTSVTLQRLSDEIEPLINNQDEERDRIVIAFAGHGLTAGSRDLWLLSKWDSKEDVIDVELMWRNLATYQPKQITVISDACRSPPPGDATLIQGRRAFTKMAWKPSKPDLDLLLATGLGLPAYMVRGKVDQKPYCLFSHVVANSLWGRYPDSIDAFQPNTVTSQSLKKAIDRNLLEAANALNQSQEADVRVTFIRPDNVYMVVAGEAAPVQALVPPAPAEPAPSQWQIIPGAPYPFDENGPVLPHQDDGGRLPSDLVKRLDQIIGRPVEHAFRNPPQPPPSAPAADLRRLRAEKIVGDLRAQADSRPTHFETQTGVATVGGHIRDAAVTPGAMAQLDDSMQAPPDSRGRWWLLNGPPSSLAVEVAETRHWIGAALFPEKIGTFSLDERGASALVYRRGRLPQSDWEARIDAAASATAEEAIAEMHAGTLTGEPARNLAAHIRQWKHADPVLGVIAAYLYARLNDVSSIHRLAWFYPVNQQPIPFDIALLGEMPMRRVNGLLVADIPKTHERPAQAEREADFDFTTQATPETKDCPVAGGFPWLRQGWDLLDDIDPDAFAPLIDLAKGLNSALFTTLRPDEGAALAKLIREGRV